uniref:Carbohydrate-binding protein n=1 Tax=Peronospora matthiolae TaxID=2874970 RepID=A0AAV1VP70_9STRA
MLRTLPLLLVALWASFSAAVDVSVCRDATYDIAVEASTLCAGAGAFPAGTQCPKTGNIAIADCYSYLPSYVDGTCVAPEDAVCQVVTGDTWGCVLPSIGCDDAILGSPGCAIWDYFGNLTEHKPFDGHADIDYDARWFIQTSPLRDLLSCGVEEPTPAPTTPRPTPAATVPARIATPAPTRPQRKIPTPAPTTRSKVPVPTPAPTTRTKVPVPTPTPAPTTRTEIPVPTPAPTEKPTEAPIWTETPTESPSWTEPPTESLAWTEIPTESPAWTEPPTESLAWSEIPTESPAWTEPPTESLAWTDTPTELPSWTENSTEVPWPTVTNMTNTTAPGNASIDSDDGGVRVGDIDQRDLTDEVSLSAVSLSVDDAEKSTGFGAGTIIAVAVAAAAAAVAAVGAIYARNRTQMFPEVNEADVARRGSTEYEMVVTPPHAATSPQGLTSPRIPSVLLI